MPSVVILPSGGDRRPLVMIALLRNRPSTTDVTVGDQSANEVAAKVHTVGALLLDCVPARAKLQDESILVELLVQTRAELAEHGYRGADDVGSDLLMPHGSSDATATQRPR